MRFRVLLVLTLLAGAAAADHLTLSRRATVREEANSRSTVINRYDRGQIIMVRDGGAMTNRWYRVIDPLTGQHGFTFQTMGRLTLGEAPPGTTPPATAPSAGALTAAQLEDRLDQVWNISTASFGTPPQNDLATLPDDVLALVCWNIQTGGTTPGTTTGRPAQVQLALGQMYAGTFQFLAAQEIASAAAVQKLRSQLPGGVAVWQAAMVDTTASMDNGFWFRGTVPLTDHEALFVRNTTTSTGKVERNEDQSRFPPQQAHVTVGDFDFTIITLHLRFDGGDEAESRGEMETLLDHVDAYFNRTDHDPDLIICGDFNLPSGLHGPNKASGITLDEIIDADPRFNSGNRRLAVLVHEKTSRSTSGQQKGQPVNNYDHFIVSFDCLEELMSARRMDTRILHQQSDEVRPDGTRKLTSDHHPIVAFFRTRGPGIARDRP